MTVNRDWFTTPYQGDRQHRDYGRCGPIMASDIPHDNDWQAKLLKVACWFIGVAAVVMWCVL